mmetsp:Transcript_16763/g.22156  ORF Transcript_16763/g.22156 Transcript_16763/m.22156 type:complete len:101 (+) Transcript_16763:396-698(+)
MKQGEQSAWRRARRPKARAGKRKGVAEREQESQNHVELQVIETGQRLMFTFPTMLMKAKMQMHELNGLDEGEVEGRATAKLQPQYLPQVMVKQSIQNHQQ